MIEVSSNGGIVLGILKSLIISTIIVTLPSPWQPFIGYDTVSSPSFGACVENVPEPSFNSAEAVLQCIAKAGDLEAARDGASYAARRLLEDSNSISHLDLIQRLQSFASALPRVSTTPAPHQTCSKQNASVSKAETVPVRSFGSVSGVITYQYNKFVGTKGDTGANVYLIPKALKNKVQKTDVWLIKGTILSELTCSQKYGVLQGKADGFGNVTFDRVPIGEYYAFVISSLTTRAYWEPFTTGELAMLEPLLASNVTSADLNQHARLRFTKFSVEFLTVRSKETTHFSKDFGNTAF